MERGIGFATSEYGFAESAEAAVAAFSWPRFLAIQIWLTLFFLFYAVSHELAERLGREKMMRMFFGPLPDAPQRAPR